MAPPGTRASRALACNVAALPLAALGQRDRVIAAAATAFSSSFVVSNSLRLRRSRAVSTTPTAKAEEAGTIQTRQAQGALA